MTAAGEEQRPAVGWAGRPLAVGTGTAVVALVLALFAATGRPALAAGAFVVQVAAGLAWVRCLDLPAPAGVVGIAVVAAAAGDAVLGAADPDQPAPLRPLAAIVAVALLVAMLHQLLRRGRTRVTAALAGTVGLVVLVVGGALLVALPADAPGRAAAVAALLGVLAGVLVARLVDERWPLPALSANGSRGLVGALAGLVAAAVTGLVYGGIADALSGGTGFAVALLAGAVALVTDVGVDLGTGPVRPAPGPDEPVDPDPGRPGFGDPWSRLGLAVVLPLLVAAVPAYAAAQLALR